jgi:site-specific DNA-methyltransferase (adenine-specific)
MAHRSWRRASIQIYGDGGRKKSSDLVNSVACKTLMTTKIGDSLAVLKTMPDASVHCCVSSPPYFGLRDYVHPGQIGLEKTPEQYIEHLVDVFRQVRRVLRKDGTLWLVLGDSYNGFNGNRGRSKSYQAHTDEAIPSLPKKNGLTVKSLGNKQLLGIPWRVALALQADGWILRQDIIWKKPNPMPSSVTDRCTTAHEYIFLFSKYKRYHFDIEAMKEPATSEDGTNGKRTRRSVWTIPTRPFKDAHFATFPPDLVRPCILAGCPKGGVVLDPFGGSGTTGQVALEEGRKAVVIEINPAYKKLITARLKGVSISNAVKRAKPVARR